MFSTLWASMMHIFGAAPAITAIEAALPVATTVATDVLTLVSSVFPQHTEVLSQEASKVASDASLAKSYVHVASSLVDSMKAVKTPSETVATVLGVVGAIKPQYAATIASVTPTIVADIELCKELIGLLSGTSELSGKTVAQAAPLAQGADLSAPQSSPDVTIGENS